MRQLDTILSTLLLRNNCVIIPSLGGFVANNISAKVDTVNGVIIPPKKALNFNRNLNNNDGLIVHFLAAQEAISYDEAQTIVSSEVQAIKIDLKKGKRISFANVGYLFIDRFGKVAFEQDRFFNLLLSSYGMGKVHFLAEEEVQPTKQAVRTVQNDAPVTEINKKVEPTPAVEEKKHKAKVPIVSFHPSPVEEKKTPPKEEHVSEANHTEQPKVIPMPVSAERKTEKHSTGLIRRIGKYAAVASLATILFYSIWIPMRTDVLESGIIYSKDFNPFSSTASTVYNTEKQPQDLVLNTLQPTNVLKAIVNNLNSSTAVFAYPLSDDLYIPVRRKGIAPQPKTKITTPKSTSSTPVKKGRFDVIAGCFSNPSNAKDFIKRLKVIGCNAYQVDMKGGLHRISAGNFSNKSSLHSLRSKLKQEGIATWILTH